jgi:hypothetical protein
LNHYFISHAPRECVETHILKLGWLRSETRSISESKKKNLSIHSNELVERYERTQEKYFAIINIYLSDLV